MRHVSDLGAYLLSTPQVLEPHLSHFTKESAHPVSGNHSLGLEACTRENLFTGLESVYFQAIQYRNSNQGLFTIDLCRTSMSNVVFAQTRETP